MTKSQAIQYALKKVPQILPLEEDDVKNLCEQVLKASGSNSESIAQGFLEFLGHDDLAFKFVIGFNDIFSQEEAKPQVTPHPRVEQKKVSSVEPIKEVKQEKKLQHVPQEKPKKYEKSKLKAKRNQLIHEIDEVWKFLELEHNEKDVKKYACDCQGNIHPLFEAAPNCLSCGKIICAKEGLHLGRCTFCATEFIPLEERLKIVQLLKKEKEELSKESTHKEQTTQRPIHKKKYANAFKISSGMGTNLFSEQDKLFDLIERQRERERKREEVLRDKEEEEKKEVEAQKRQQRESETDPELLEAQDRLDKLLHFQDTSAERTKIIDNASDFSISNDSGVWGSAQERALMLKKQQRNLRKWEKLENERNGKRDKYVVSMDIGANGKVVMKEVLKNNGKSTADSDDDIEEISDEEDSNDLKEIHQLKGAIDSTKNEQKSALQSKVWDYEKDKKQFEPPKYIEDSRLEEQTNHEDDKTTTRERAPRVQIDQEGENLWDMIA